MWQLHTCRCACTSKCERVHVEAGDQPRAILFRNCPPWFLRHGLSLRPEAYWSNWTEWPASPKTPFVSVTPALVFRAFTPTPWLFSLGSGEQTQVHMFEQEAFYWSSLSFWFWRICTVWSDFCPDTIRGITSKEHQIVCWDSPELRQNHCSLTLTTHLLKKKPLAKLPHPLKLPHSYDRTRNPLDTGGKMEWHWSGPSRVFTDDQEAGSDARSLLQGQRQVARASAPQRKALSPPG